MWGEGDETSPNVLNISDYMKFDILYQIYLSLQHYMTLYVSFLDLDLNLNIVKVLAHFDLYLKAFIYLFDGIMTGFGNGIPG